MRILHNTNIDFLSKRKYLYILSIVLIVIGLAVFIIEGIPLGIDFKGGTEVLVRFQNDIEIHTVRDAMIKTGLVGSEIKTFDIERDILIRTAEEEEGTIISDKIRDGLITYIPDNPFEVLKTDKVGPKIGKELRVSAIYATIFSLLCILVYLSLRFEFIFAIGAVFALFHDVLMTLSLISIFCFIFPSLNLELSQGMVAAFLTLVGFSTNDTIVVFDRIRENIKLYKNVEILNVMNKSINATLSRTIITSGTVLTTIVVLLILGGEVLRSFSFTFMIGIITGTYSSIYIASSLVVEIKHKTQKRKAF